MQHLLNKKLIPYIMTVIIFILYNISIYQYLQYKQKTKEQLILEHVQHNIITLLSNDIEGALNSGLFDRTFFLLKKYIVSNNTTLLPNVPLNFILTDGSSLYINNSRNTFIFSLQILNEIITKIVPNYVLYKIQINDQEIATNNSYNYYYLVSRQYNINDQVNIIVKLGINPYSEYYLSNIKKLYYCLLVNVIAAFVICSVILYVYLRVKHNITFKIERLEANLLAEKKINNAMLLHKQASKHLTTFFIKKATEEYIHQQLALESNQAIKVDDVDSSNYLFPICFNNGKQSEIVINELVSNLKDYFAEHFLYTVIKYNYSINKLIIDCGQHVFYQIIYSLIYNVINFMEDQSNVPKCLSITFNYNKLIISYDGFLLTEQTMINLSNNVVVENIDPFLLNCSKIFQSLKEHELNYIIYNANKRNIIEIELRKDLMSNKEKAKVISLTKYKRKP